MNTPTAAARFAAEQNSLRSDMDRVARLDGRPQRTTPLMRKYEAACLLPSGDIKTSHHIAPATPLFEDAVAAFARGTLMATPMGPVAVEDLLPGDMILTDEHGPREILWIGATTIVPRAEHETPRMIRLTRFMADAFGEGRPMTDVMTGPGARVLQSVKPLEAITGHGEVYMPVSDLVDGLSVIEVSPPSPVRVFHIHLAEHATIRAGGLPVESYHPGSRAFEGLGRNMRTLFMSLFPHIREYSDFGRLSHPRATRESIDSLTAA